MRTHLVYFAYGSNLHPARLEARIGEVRLLATGALRGARLRFHKIGRDGSGKCSVDLDAGPDEAVPGAAYAVTEDQRERLDGFEGEGRHYRRTEVKIHTTAGRVRAFTYVALPHRIDDALVPFHWYLALVRHGARHLGFPPSYVQWLERHPSRPDPDPARAAEHGALLEAIARTEGPRRS